MVLNPILGGKSINLHDGMCFVAVFWNNSDGKASLKRQRTPETTTYTQDGSKFY